MTLREFLKEIKTWKREKNACRIDTEKGWRYYDNYKIPGSTLSVPGSCIAAFRRSEFDKDTTSVDTFYRNGRQILWVASVDPEFSYAIELV